MHGGSRKRWGIAPQVPLHIKLHGRGPKFRHGGVATWPGFGPQQNN